jgi:acetyl esterase
MHAALEHAIGLVARIIPKLPAPLLRLLAGRPIEIDGQLLSPEVQLALRLEGLYGGWQPLPVAEVREQTVHDARIFSGPRIAVARTEELVVAGAVGPIAARLYVPEDAPAPAPLIVYYHGGGHVICDLDTHDQPCRFLARETATRLLSIDYRLAPEHPFPAAVEDALAAFRWAHAEAERLGVDPDRIAVVGDSAGANLATVVCQLAAADGGPAPAFQALIYPLIDYSTKRRSYELFGDGFYLTNAEMDWYREHYLVSHADRDDPRVSPILAGDLSALPPALVVTAGFDPLRDEGEAYAERLREAGVRTTAWRESDLIHGFINAAGIGGRPGEATARIAAEIRGRLSTAPSARHARQRLP